MNVDILQWLATIFTPRHREDVVEKNGNRVRACDTNVALPFAVEA